MKAFLLFLVLLISGCSTLKTGSNNVTLDACKGSSCESRFSIHSSKEEWIEQLVFELEVPLEMGILKNTRAGSRPYLGVGYSSEHPLLIFVPIGQKVSEVPMNVIIIHQAPHTIKLKLKSPSISVEPTR